MAARHSNTWRTVTAATSDLLGRFTCDTDHDKAREVIWQMYTTSSLDLDGFMRCMLAAWRETQAADRSMLGFVERLNSERIAAVGRSVAARMF